VALPEVMIMERERLRRERVETKASVLALRDANQRMDEFLSSAGHELRTPLTIMKANVQMAVRRVRHLVSQEDAAGYGAFPDVGALQVQAHNTTRGAAGPTAGLPQEDLQHHLGSAAMQDEETAIQHERVDHRLDELPPKFAESGAQSPGFRIESDGEHRQVMAEIGTTLDPSAMCAANRPSGVQRMLANTLREATSAAHRLRTRGRRLVTTRGTDADEAASA
jgi:signal transduction histidine kinase